eukprot:TRINITY_DN3609_c0_g1_i1.p1 TRINITY_DN3609_c0_g1~~TRINITY_DN3609_c0_g1_i1.p1  ORF type:complete len:147 (-),score=20.50 TRINITY_DN3609_c0_g1_i1:23-397(-)
MGKPFNLTRLLSCTEPLPELTRRVMSAYPEVNFYIVKPTKEFTGVDWKFINKPASVFQWVHNADIKEPYVIITDPDWILIKPWNITGVKKGHPLGGNAYGYGYRMKYTNNIVPDVQMKLYRIIR